MSIRASLECADISRFSMVMAKSAIASTSPNLLQSSWFARMHLENQIWYTL